MQREDSGAAPALREREGGGEGWMDGWRGKK